MRLSISIFATKFYIYMYIKKNIPFLLLFIATVSFAQDVFKKTSFENALKYDKAFDLQHTKLEVSFNIPKEILYGKAWVTLSPHFYSAQKVVLDAKGMLIHKISLLEKVLDFHYDGEKIYIDLDKEYVKDEKLELLIEYTARPAKVKQKGGAAITDARGLYFINAQGLDKDKPTQIWTQGETEASSCWFPTIDKPNQKSTQEIAIRVPKRYKTLSNGLLISEKNHENGDRTDYWKMNQKHAPYLFFMGVGEFVVVKDVWRGKEVSYYVEKEYESVAKKIFGKTPKMMDYFSEITGVDFVWDKYSQIVVRDYVSGAMENTTAVVHGEKAYQSEGDLIDENSWEPVIAHELFHHWFGDLVTTENWGNLSLNESFANYSEYLWLLHEYGKNKADAHLATSIEGYKKGLNEMKQLVRFDYKDKEDLFDAVSYNKGGAILHMLKSYLGDAAFFAGLKKYLTDNKFSTAEVPQLRMVFEEVSGKDLNWFFNQWYYGAGHPIVRVSYDYNILEKTVTATLKQQGDVFYFPLTIEIHENNKKSVHKVFIDDAEKSFTFSYTTDPDWINVNSDHVVLGDFTQNKTLRNYKYQYKNATHFLDRKEALEYLADYQEDKEVFGIMVDGFDDSFYQLQVLALEKINLSYKHTKRQVIAKIEELARSAENNLVKAAAIKVLGKLVYFDYQVFFEQAFESKSNAVKGSALEALYYLDKKSAMNKAKQLPNSVKERIAFPLSKMYLEERDISEMAFVAKHIMQGMYLLDDKETKALYKSAFRWVSKSNNVEAFKNLTKDMVAKGNQYRKYNFHLEVIAMLREMVGEQDKLKNSNKKELISIVKLGLEKLID